MLVYAGPLLLSSSVFSPAARRQGLGDAPLEAAFMWALLDPALLSGEGGYYLTTLSSALAVVQDLGAGAAVAPARAPAGEPRLPRVDDMQNVLRVTFADALGRHAGTKAVAVQRTTTAHEAIAALLAKTPGPPEDPAGFAVFEVRTRSFFFGCLCVRVLTQWVVAGGVVPGRLRAAARRDRMPAGRQGRLARGPHVFVHVPAAALVRAHPARPAILP